MENTTTVDRFIFTLLFSVIIHLVIVLGVTFGVTSPPTNQALSNLEITLVKQQTEQEPEQADFLAQANNEGGGETDEKSPEPTPDEPIPEDIEPSTAELTPPQEMVPEPIPEPLPIPETPVIEPEPEVIKQVEVPPEPVEPTKPKEVITQAEAERKVEVAEVVEDKIEDVVPEIKPQLSASDLILQARSEISRLEKKLDESKKALSKRPIKRRLSSSTKEYAAAAYHEAWRRKVERIGNLNYPQEAKRQRINGSLMLSVDINPDGSVPPDGIVISRSSGHKVLDDAAVKIVRLAAPYAAIPENVLQGHDMITIVRTWKFETDHGLLAR